MLVLGGADGRFRAIHRHGVISAGALTPVLVCFHKLEITPPSNFNHPRDGTAHVPGLGQVKAKQTIEPSADALSKTTGGVRRRATARSSE